MAAQSLKVWELNPDAWIYIQFKFQHSFEKSVFYFCSGYGSSPQQGSYMDWRCFWKYSVTISSAYKPHMVLRFWYAFFLLSQQDLLYLLYWFFFNAISKWADNPGRASLTGFQLVGSEILPYACEFLDRNNPFRKSSSLERLKKLVIWLSWLKWKLFKDLGPYKFRFW